MAAATEDAKQRPLAFKKEKEIYQTIDYQIKELNTTFKEQTKCLEDRAGTQMAVLEMAYDFLRKWADLESEHSQKMEKLVKSFANKEKSGNNGNVSISVCLLGLFSTCSKLGKMYQQLAETITSQMVERLQVAREESQIVRKNCTPILEQCQDSIRKSVQEVMSTVKPYHAASSGFASAEQHYKEAQSELNKLSGGGVANGSAKTSTGSALPQSAEQPSKPKKQASVERKLADRQAKRDKFLAQLNEERNRHIISLSAANSALNCYNTEILPRYIKSMDYCARPAICLALGGLAKFMESAERSVVGASDELKSAVTRCQAENDVALMANYAPKLFSVGSRNQQIAVFRFQPLRGDEPGELVLPPAIRDSKKLSLSNLNNENAKKMTGVVADLERYEQARWAPAVMTDSGLSLGQQPAVPATIDNYAQTLRQYSEIAEQIARNDYELSLMNSSLPVGFGGGYSAANSSFTSPQRGGGGGFLHSTSVDNGPGLSSGRPSGADHMISSGSVGSSSSGDNMNNASRTPVFGGSIEDHLNRVGLSQSLNESVRSVSATPHTQLPHTPGNVSLGSVTSSVSSAPPPPLPPVVVSCVTYLSKYGLRQQGVFRINGSQIEISDLKSKFERCENPLAAVDNPSSVNAAASVLKSYFRQLREPLLLPSTVTFEQWIAVSTAPQGMVEAIRLIVAKLPSQIRTVAAFMFAFLNRVQQLSTENMMDAYNLAVCFAPCLLPTPTETDQMQHFNALAAIIKAMIINVDSIFREEDVRLYDEVINGKPEQPQQHQQIAAVNRNSIDLSQQQQQQQQQQPQKFIRKGSLTAEAADNHHANHVGEPQQLGNNGPTSLTRQFRTLAAIDASTVSSQTIKVATDGSTSNGMPDDCEAMFNFTARNNHEMSLRRGDRMRVVRKLSEQWWEVMMGGRSGLVPANYLRMLTPAPSPALTSTVSLQNTLSSQSGRVRSGTGSGSVPESTPPSSSSEQTNPNGTAGNGSLLTRHASASNGAVKVGNGQDLGRRVFNNETNELANTARLSGSSAGADSNNGALANSQLWMRRQASSASTASNGEHRKSDTVVISSTTVIETTIGPKSTNHS